MNFTIVSARTYGGEQELFLDTDGNKYCVCLVQQVEPRESKYALYDTIEEAYRHFEMVARCFAFGTHTFEQRLAMLADTSL